MERRHWSIAVLLVGAVACTPASPGGQAAPSHPDAGALTAEIDRAVALRERGQQVEGLKILEETRRQALADSEAALATMALNRHGDLLNDLHRTREAAKDYEAAYAEAERHGDAFAMGRAAHDRAYMNETCGGEDDASISWYLKAVEARRKAKDQAGLRRSANNLAGAYFHRKQDADAKRFWAEALEAGTAIQDWEGVYKIEGNLALLWSLAAEGVFAGDGPLRPWVPPLKLDPPAEAEARGHYARAIAAAERMGRGERDVCGALGNYAARCERLKPGVVAEEGLVAFFAALAQEADSDAETSTDAELALLQAGTLYLRSSDASRLLGKARAQETANFEKLARERLKSAVALGAKSLGSAELFCATDRARELCGRFNDVAKGR